MEVTNYKSTGMEKEVYLSDRMDKFDYNSKE